MSDLATSVSKVGLSVRALYVALSAGLLFGSCNTPAKIPFTHLRYWNGQSLPGYYYVVQRGDTLASIAQHFGSDMNLLARINGIQPNRALGASERIFVPRTRGDFPRAFYAKPKRSDPAEPAALTQTALSSPPDSSGSPAIPWGQPPQGPTVVMVPTPRPVVVAQAAVFKYPPAGGTSVAPVTQTVASRAPSNPSLASPPAQTASALRRKGIEIAQTYHKRRFSPGSQATVPNAPRFVWPTEGTLSSPFNVRSTGTRLHMGIDVAAPRGTPIRAAYAGRVLYSDHAYLPSMGNMVLIEHGGGWITLYAHNERNLVKEGDFVETGQAIASVGMTGNATGPHLHFEVRKDADTPVNPLEYLPVRR